MHEGIDNPIENLKLKLKKKKQRLQPAKLVWQLLQKEVGTRLMRNSVFSLVTSKRFQAALKAKGGATKN